MKIDVYIAQSGYSSRRKAMRLIEAGRVEVNGKTASYKTEVKEGDEVRIDALPINGEKQKPVWLAYHKPKGIVCTTEKVENNIIDALALPFPVYPVGRLDKDSEGLILLTNQGAMIDKITNPSNEHEKEYIVTLNLPVRKKFLDEIKNGIVLKGVQTKPCEAWPEPGTRRIFRIVLEEGMNRQIRKMCNAYDYQVIKLQRVRVMNIELGKLKPGEWRELTEEELSTLFARLK